jgi:hypothetical protein
VLGAATPSTHSITKASKEPGRYCKRCGRRITDKASVRAGYGPKCLRQLHLEEAEERQALLFPGFETEDGK